MDLLLATPGVNPNIKNSAGQSTLTEASAKVHATVAKQSPATDGIQPGIRSTGRHSSSLLNTAISSRGTATRWRSPRKRKITKPERHCLMRRRGVTWGIVHVLLVRKTSVVAHRCSGRQRRAKKKKKKKKKKGKPSCFDLNKPNKILS